MQRRRNPDETRARILEAAAQEIHAKGFGVANVDDIARRSGVTKGALYHHFPTKADLGYAVVEEVIGPTIQGRWKEALDATPDPLVAIRGCMAAKLERMDPADARLGCPLNNLMQEMSALDEGFRLRLRAQVVGWTEHLVTALRRGQEAGTVRADLDPVAAAHFIVAAVEGMAGLAKNSGEPEVARRGVEGFLGYLESLRPMPPITPSV